VTANDLGQSFISNTTIVIVVCARLPFVVISFVGPLSCIFRDIGHGRSFQ